MKTFEVDGVIWATDPKGNTYPEISAIGRGYNFKVLRAKILYRNSAVKQAKYMSDTVGKSLSISDEDHGLMMQVPFNAILKEITGGRNK